MNTSAQTKRWVAAAAAAGVAVAVLGFTGAGAAAGASAPRIGPAIYTTSQAGYTVGGGRWFRFVATTVTVTPQPQHSAMAPSVTRAEVVLGGAGVHPATLGVWAGGGRGSVGYSCLHNGRWVEGTLPLSPRVGDIVTLRLYYDRHGHDVFSATDVTKGLSAGKTVGVGPTIYTNAGVSRKERSLHHGKTSPGRGRQRRARAAPTATAPRQVGPVLLIMMYEAGTWRAMPGQALTFGRGTDCTITLPDADHGLSRRAGSLSFRNGAWWLHNDSSSAMLYLTGDRGFRVDLPPGMAVPVQQWHAWVRLQGVLGSYTLRLRLPDLDDIPDQADVAGQASHPPSPSPCTGDRKVTSTRLRARLTDSDRLVLAARFEEYLDWRHTGTPAPRSAKDAAKRIGWPPHTVAKRCENLRDRYSRLGVPGLHGPHALEELATILISTEELTAQDLKRLPAKARIR